MRWIKIFLLNILITFALLGSLLILPPAVYSSYRSLKAVLPSRLSDERPFLSLYKNYAWAKTHFAEIRELTTQYYDYIVWRRNDYVGKTVSIKDGLRQTFSPVSLNENGEIFWFFGGSTTWGTGVNDDLTYPSLFARRNNVSVINFGETGYVARQSLAYLTNYLISNNISDLSNVNVVFYDGANDVIHRCRTEIKSLAGGREAQIQRILGSAEEKFSLRRTFLQIKDFIRVVLEKFGWKPIASAKNYYACGADTARASEVARTLVGIWKTASQMVSARGGNFVAILQPVAQVGSAKVDYLKM